MAYCDHLNDHSTYCYLSPSESKRESTKLMHNLKDWLQDFKDDLTKGELKFLQRSTKQTMDPFPVFYLTLKVHKRPLKSHPIISCSGSLLYGLAIWVDSQLQKVAQTQWSYFKRSLNLKQEMDQLQLAPTAQLFSTDAVSMYTNIPATQAFQIIYNYLALHDFVSVPIDALVSTLSIIMKNNVFTSGDTTWKQKSGTAMVAPPAPPYATLYYTSQSMKKSSLIDLQIPSASTNTSSTIELAFGIHLWTQLPMLFIGKHSSNT